MSAGVMLFNPFTGKPRHPSDIASDPHGALIWDGDEPLRAAAERNPLPTNSHLSALEALRIANRRPGDAYHEGWNDGIDAAMSVLEGIPPADAKEGE